MAYVSPKLMTVDEFITWEDGTDTRYELMDGVVRAVTPLPGYEGVVKGSLCGIIGQILRPRRPYHAEVSPMIRISDDTMWLVDLGVSCERIGDHPPTVEIIKPLLLVETMSAASASHDLGRKLPDYVALPTVQEIWMVHSERRWVQAWYWDGKRWSVEVYSGRCTLGSRILDSSIPLDEVYEHMPF